MVKHIKQTISLLLLVVYVMFFASANLCYHSHQLADGTIVHSHIFFGGKTHSHTASQLQIVDQLNNATYENTECIQIQSFLPEYSEQIVVREVIALTLIPQYSFSLRAPPVA